VRLLPHPTHTCTSPFPLACVVLQLQQQLQEALEFTLQAFHEVHGQDDAQDVGQKDGKGEYQFNSDENLAIAGGLLLPCAQGGCACAPCACQGTHALGVQVSACMHAHANSPSTPDTGKSHTPSVDTWCTHKHKSAHLQKNTGT